MTELKTQRKILDSRKWERQEKFNTEIVVYISQLQKAILYLESRRIINRIKAIIAAIKGKFKKVDEKNNK